ncbi:class II fructose-bisphosphate aldolase [Stackebrandtia nassauensis]|uniref:Tagatose-bisphosphate aldolase n=1 Tax=Stackebrandtia nassauensis (strain DSM 44728 / CIP 108903 / NRRL B-16338 / NBRC 102104 / LLR-40K-21) TaxID=446470 RepID=D3Q2S8_STANL|nr:class II fructose-bisphosphate aldolase [Stackebrandtia nassauensis]ADD45829.1 Tagatose-bisphosphate aldolase [Stackebrandtia nassauensis DSM 44728]
MALVPTAELMENTRGGVGAFNVITVEHAEAIVDGAGRAERPVILQISENAIKFHHGQIAPIAAATAAVAETSDVPVALHLDHVTDASLWEVAPQHGFGSVMIDASKLPYAENVDETGRAVEYLNSRGLWVESELGQVGGKDGEAPLSAHAPGARTSPDEAAAYVMDTGVDALAVAVGSSHAMTTRDAVLDHDLIAAIKEAVAIPLVLHGSSGVPDAELAKAVRGGMIKINIGTALNIAYTDAVRGHLAANPDNVDPRKYLAAAREAMAAKVSHFLTVLAG